MLEGSSIWTRIDLFPYSNIIQKGIKKCWNRQAHLSSSKQLLIGSSQSIALARFTSTCGPATTMSGGVSASAISRSRRSEGTWLVNKFADNRSYWVVEGTSTRCKLRLSTSWMLARTIALYPELKEDSGICGSLCPSHPSACPRLPRSHVDVVGPPLQLPLPYSRM